MVTLVELYKYLFSTFIAKFDGKNVKRYNMKQRFKMKAFRWKTIIVTKTTMTLHCQCQASCASSTISTGVVCREDGEGKNVQPCPRDHNTRTMPCHSFGDILPNLYFCFNNIPYSCLTSVTYSVEPFKNTFQLLKIIWYKYKMLLQNSIIHKALVQISAWHHNFRKL